MIKFVDGKSWHMKCNQILLALYWEWTSGMRLRSGKDLVVSSRLQKSSRVATASFMIDILAYTHLLQGVPVSIENFSQVYHPSRVRIPIFSSLASTK